MIFDIDHLVFSATAEQQAQTRRILAESGFTPMQFRLEFPEIGAVSESLAYAGGGFTEFVYELEGRRGPEVWFDATPRLIGLGFASDDFASDTAWDTDEAWLMDEKLTLEDGSTVVIRGAGPHVHLSDFYVFAMDRPDGTLEFAGVTEGARLRRLTLVGADASAWRERLERWFGLERRGDVLLAGEVELHFERTDRPSVRARPTFAVSNGSAGSVTLGVESIEVVVEGI